MSSLSSARGSGLIGRRGREQENDPNDAPLGGRRRAALQPASASCRPDDSRGVYEDMVPALTRLGRTRHPGSLRCTRCGGE